MATKLRNIIAGYAKNDAKITKAAAELTGKKISANPGEYLNFWVSYNFTEKFLRNIGFGFGGNYVADSYFDIANTITIPSYKAFNASLFMISQSGDLLLRQIILAMKFTIMV